MVDHHTPATLGKHSAPVVAPAAGGEAVPTFDRGEEGARFPTLPEIILKGKKN